MNKIRIAQIIGGTISIIIGVCIAIVSTDQQFFDLTPSNEPESRVVLDSTHVYEQTFLIHRKTLSRLGLYMTPVGKISSTTATIAVSILRKGGEITTKEIPALFIEHGGPAYIRFDTPIITHRGEYLTARIRVPDEISGSIALRMRRYDSMIFPGDVSFTIDGIQQQEVIAHNAFEMIRPSFLQQFGGFLVLFGIGCIVFPIVRFHTQVAVMVLMVGIASLHSISAYNASRSYILFTIGVSMLLIGMYYFLRIIGRSYLSAIVGAAVFALSSWLPLHIVTGWKIQETLSMRDTLLDPNQISVSHSAGAYVGFFAIIAACIGIGIWAYGMFRKQYVRHQIDTAIICVLILASIVTFIPSPLVNGHAAIIVAFAIAYFASLGLHGLQVFLGRNDKVATAVLWILSTIAILDLMHITALTFTYGLGV